MRIRSNTVWFITFKKSFFVWNNLSRQFEFSKYFYLYSAASMIEGYRWENKGREQQHTEDWPRSNKSRFCTFCPLLQRRRLQTGPLWIYLFSFWLITGSVFSLSEQLNVSFCMLQPSKISGIFPFMCELFSWSLSWVKVGSGCTKPRLLCEVHERLILFCLRVGNHYSSSVVFGSLITSSGAIFLPVCHSMTQLLLVSVVSF